MNNKQSEHTSGVKLAVGDINDVINSFKNDTPFMQRTRSPRADRQREIIANASPDLQELVGRFPLHMIERLARAEAHDG